jgi:hypothetical protein
VSWGTYGGQSPSPDGIRWHPASEAVNRPTRIRAGQGRENPAHDKRPQQDSNLRSRLRRALIMTSVTWTNGREHKVWGASGVQRALASGLVLVADEQ